MEGEDPHGRVPSARVTKKKRLASQVRGVEETTQLEAEATSRGLVPVQGTGVPLG